MEEEKTVGRLTMWGVEVGGLEGVCPFTNRTRPEPEPRTQRPPADLLDVGDAVRPVLPLSVEVSVRERHEPPAHGEEQPAADEGGGEDDEREAPLEVHERGEDVLQEAALLADVLVRQVARAVLGDEARLVNAVAEHRLARHARDEPRQAELLRDDALPGQHPGTETSRAEPRPNATVLWRLTPCASSVRLLRTDSRSVSE